MARKRTLVSVALAITVVAAATVSPRMANAQSAGAPRRRCTSSGPTSGQGESTLASNDFDDGARLAVEDLQKQGWEVNYERIPSGGTNATQMEQAFLAAQAKIPTRSSGSRRATRSFPLDRRSPRRTSRPLPLRHPLKV